MNKNRMLKLAGLLKESKKTLTELTVLIKGKRVNLPKLYVVRLHTKVPSDGINGLPQLGNIRVGQYLSKDGSTGTSDVNNARVFSTDYHFENNMRKFEGDYFEPLEVEKIIRLKK